VEHPSERAMPEGVKPYGMCALPIILQGAHAGLFFRRGEDDFVGISPLEKKFLNGRRSFVSRWNGLPPADEKLFSPE
jgi:hypothetical protein